MRPQRRGLTARDFLVLELGGLQRVDLRVDHADDPLRRRAFHRLRGGVTDKSRLRLFDNLGPARVGRRNLPSAKSAETKRSKTRELFLQREAGLLRDGLLLLLRRPEEVLFFRLARLRVDQGGLDKLLVGPPLAQDRIVAGLAVVGGDGDSLRRALLPSAVV
jgi:hypothetical protein